MASHNAAVSTAFSFATAGQCLIKHDLRWVKDPGFLRLAETLRATDLVFGDFEGAILGDASCWPTKTGFCSAVSPATLDSLKEMGFSALSLANNHAFDLGPGGILAGLEAVKSRGFLHAGTGRDFAEAARPGYRDYAFGRVALVAMDCVGKPTKQISGALNADKERGIPARPGVNVLEIEAGANDGGIFFREEDVQRHLNAVREAAENADFVIVYVHHHPSGVPEYYRSFGRKCIDAGADVLVGHGKPVFEGVEIYKNRPLFYNLANFIFHSSSPEFWRARLGDQPWESFLVTMTFENGLKAMKAIPVTLDMAGCPPGEERLTTYPVPADRERGDRILRRLADLSRPFGTSWSIEEGAAHWVR